MTEISPKDSLYQDLIEDWHEQKAIIKEQMTLIDPMATSLRKSTAQRFLNASMNVLMEILMYLLSLGSIIYLFFMNNLGPFFVMGKVAGNPEIVPAKISSTEMEQFDYTVKGMFVLLAILFFIIGRMLANIRKKNSTLSLAGKNMKTIAGQHLKRKSKIESLEQKHVMTLPETDINIDSIGPIEYNNNTEDTLL
ncbi:hypothetical protein DBR32_09040 [Taibaiella sp. KBW10]|uniref:hypothetical protein n=1 Tax=Taibaiella sp. KBW10 TaxID=2153357 RepID=UPI000F5B4327|nr:hypothetical protein [Taibaiella sp. KBW10]RQO30852.1 hypothetical protein DBR32_09040 [Taibaiella sp. KBW10]